MSPRTRTKVPRGPIPTRLEGVRADRGLSLNKFHEAVVAATGSTVTYRSVQRYHTDDVAPVQYLLDVAETFDVSMDWLCRGLSVPRQAPPNFEARKGLWAPISDSADQVVQAAFWVLNERLLSAMPLATDGTIQRYSLTEDQKWHVAGFIIRAVLWPLEILLGGYERIPPEDLDQYLRHILEGLRRVIPPPASGLSYQELLGVSHEDELLPDEEG